MACSSVAKSNEKKEVMGLHRITKKRLLELCKKDKLYQTPALNDVLYLHYQGFQYIECLEEYTELKCLWLESNAISEIQGLENQPRLKCLFLQNNLIKRIENLEHCTELDTINLSCNHIRKIENCGSKVLPSLNTLNLASNYLTDSEGLRELEDCKTLSVLDLSNNRIDDILVVKVFAKMPQLRVLVLQGNPVVSKLPQYRKTIILECKELTYLDSRPVFPKDRACAEAWKRGGYEEERKENDRWHRKERSKMREGVNATIRLRNKYRAADDQLSQINTSDSEDEESAAKRCRHTEVDAGIGLELGIWGEVAESKSGTSSDFNVSSSSSALGSTDSNGNVSSDSKESEKAEIRRNTNGDKKIMNNSIEKNVKILEIAESGNLENILKVVKTKNVETEEEKPGVSSIFTTESKNTIPLIEEIKDDIKILEIAESGNLENILKVVEIKIDESAEEKQGLSSSFKVKSKTASSFIQEINEEPKLEHIKADHETETDKTAGAKINDPRLKTLKSNVCLSGTVKVRSSSSTASDEDSMDDYNEAVNAIFMIATENPSRPESSVSDENLPEEYGVQPLINITNESEYGQKPEDTLNTGTPIMQNDLSKPGTSRKRIHIEDETYTYEPESEMDNVMDRMSAQTGVGVSLDEHKDEVNDDANVEKSDELSQYDKDCEKVNKKVQSDFEELTTNMDRFMVEMLNDREKRSSTIDVDFPKTEESTASSETDPEENSEIIVRRSNENLTLGVRNAAAADQVSFVYGEKVEACSTDSQVEESTPDACAEIREIIKPCCSMTTNTEEPCSSSEISQIFDEIDKIQNFEIKFINDENVNIAYTEFEKESNHLKTLLKRLEEENERLYDLNNTYRKILDEDKREELKYQDKATDEGSGKLCEAIIEDVIEDLTLQEQNNEPVQSKSYVFEDIESDDEFSYSHPHQPDAEPVTSIREVLTSFHDLLEEITHKNQMDEERRETERYSKHVEKTETFNTLLKSPIISEFNNDSRDTLDEKINALNEHKRKRVTKLVDRVYAQRDKYDDTLDVVDGKLVVIKKDTGEIEDIPERNESSDSDESDYHTADSEDEESAKQKWKRVTKPQKDLWTMPYKPKNRRSAEKLVHDALMDYEKQQVERAKIKAKENDESDDNDNDDDFHSLNSNIFGNIDKELIEKLDMKTMLDDIDENQMVECTRSYEELKHCLKQSEEERCLNDEENQMFEKMLKKREMRKQNDQEAGSYSISEEENYLLKKMVERTKKIEADKEKHRKILEQDLAEQSCSPQNKRNGNYSYLVCHAAKIYEYNGGKQMGGTEPLQVRGISDDDFLEEKGRITENIELFQGYENIYEPKPLQPDWIDDENNPITEEECEDSPEENMLLVERIDKCMSHQIENLKHLSEKEEKKKMFSNLVQNDKTNENFKDSQCEVNAPLRAEDFDQNQIEQNQKQQNENQRNVERVLIAEDFNQNQVDHDEKPQDKSECDVEGALRVEEFNQYRIIQDEKQQDESQCEVNGPLRAEDFDQNQIEQDQKQQNENQCDVERALIAEDFNQNQVDQDEKPQDESPRDVKGALRVKDFNQNQIEYNQKQQNESQRDVEKALLADDFNLNQVDHDEKPQGKDKCDVEEALRAEEFNQARIVQDENQQDKITTHDIIQINLKEDNDSINSQLFEKEAKTVSNIACQIAKIVQYSEKGVLLYDIANKQVQAQEQQQQQAIIEIMNTDLKDDKPNYFNSAAVKYNDTKIEQSIKLDILNNESNHKGNEIINDNAKFDPEINLNIDESNVEEFERSIEKTCNLQENEKNSNVNNGNANIDQIENQLNSNADEFIESKSRDDKPEMSDSEQRVNNIRQFMEGLNMTEMECSIGQQGQIYELFDSSITEEFVALPTEFKVEAGTKDQGTPQDMQNNEEIIKSAKEFIESTPAIDLTGRVGGGFEYVDEPETINEANGSPKRDVELLECSLQVIGANDQIIDELSVNAELAYDI